MNHVKMVSQSLAIMKLAQLIWQALRMADAAADGPRQSDGLTKSIDIVFQATILEAHGASWASQPLGSMAPSRELGAAIIHNGDLYIFGGSLPDRQDLPLSEFLMKFEPSTGRFERMDMRVEDESDDEEDSLLDSYPMPITGDSLKCTVLLMEDATILDWNAGTIVPPAEAMAACPFSTLHASSGHSYWPVLPE